MKKKDKETVLFAKWKLAYICLKKSDQRVTKDAVQERESVLQLFQNDNINKE